MCRTNALWGAPRIHGELLKLGIEISETTVAKYMIKRRGPPSQAWRTFLENHAKEAFHRQARALGMEEVSTAPRSPWQNPYAERVIGSIRRECLDHMIILGAGHLRRILLSYADYYNGTRTHLSLYNDAAEGRNAQLPERGRVTAIARVGGMHHEYVRKAA
jgi:transposase InsO family protein